MANSSLPIANADPRAGVLAAIRKASQVTGTDFDYLVKTAQRESNFDPTAKAGTSSATGLFQFTQETWLRMVDRYGSKHGLGEHAKLVSVGADGSEVATPEDREKILALRNDADLSARMAGELARENAGILEKKIGRKATSAEIYAAHFMGPTDAARLIRAARRNEAGSASDMFPAAALANTHVFETKDGRELTVAELYAKLTGAAVGDADAGKVPAAVLSERIDPKQAEAAARVNVAAMTTSLMAALFDLQIEKKKV